MKRDYIPWSNERVDNYLLDKPLIRKSNVDRWNDKIKVYCTICETMFLVTPNNLVKLHVGCPRCRVNNQIGHRKKVKYTIEEVSQIVNSYGWLLVDENYINYNTNLKLYCKNCNYEINKSLANLKKGFNKCPYCHKSN
jgi:phage FluMu protein Com